MIPVVTPAEMGAADARTIAAGTPESVLVTRAGRAVGRRVREVLGGTYGRRIVVLAGKGNNGADGRIAAAALREWGSRVAVVDITQPVSARDRRAIARADAVVDAMFGTGFRGVLEGAPAELTALVADARTARAAVIAVDIPSGVDGLTGASVGPAIAADHTVTFAAPKPGLWFHPGRRLAGTVTVADIGIDLGPGVGRVAVMEAADITDAVPARAATTHKWQSGVLVVGGSAGMIGAPMLAAHAAARLGAGIVWAALPGEAAAAASGTEVITLALADDSAGMLTLAGTGAVLEAASRFGAVVVGPGLGRDPVAATAVRELIAEVPVPLIVDADAIVALAGALAIVRGRDAPTVLTPHDGEFEGLTGTRPGDDRIDAARTLATRAGATVLLKGPTTVVADADGRVRLNPTGNAALATAGSGDVLSGMIGAFCARGMESVTAAATAAFVHGRAADLAGHTGLVAGDLPGLAGRALGQLTQT